ncbi:NAD-dependent epimerase/dehydratase family protein [Fulvimarina endophytica]|uniref:NAD-dependent epimerase/dehydratase family protein n=1 Tax=Fulvimarina endophytica TaxID=2293836 RepID=UPI0013141C11|nr:NAD-dependent epimerase/dehydratase family protein [Fulvimarina endophytica]
MRIIVSGASGFVGRHLVPELAAHGHDVVPLVRSVMDGGTFIRAPSDLSALEPTAFLSGEPFDAVIHLAALNPNRSDRTSSDEAALMAANRDGTAAVMRAAAQARIPRVVVLGTANAHAPQDWPISEASPIAPVSAYARSKAEGERMAIEIARETGVTLTILRPAPVYGAGGRGMVALLKRLADSPLPVPLPKELGQRSFVSITSLVAAILAVLDRRAGLIETFLVADAQPVSPSDIVAGLRRGRGRAPMLVPVPDALTNALLKAFGKRSHFETLRKPFVLDWSRLASHTTWQPEADTIAAMQREASRSAR